MDIGHRAEIRTGFWVGLPTPPPPPYWKDSSLFSVWFEGIRQARLAAIFSARSPQRLGAHTENGAVIMDKTVNFHVAASQLFKSFAFTGSCA